MADKAEDNWEKFGKIAGDTGDSPDPQRHVSTSYISRAGPSAVAVISPKGDINSGREGETGFYVGDMRVVSRLSVAVNGKPTAARKAIKDQASTRFSYTLKNPAPHVKAGIDYTFSDDTLFMRLRMKNTGGKPVSLTADFNAAADHFDTFYVRFPPKPERGVLHEPVNDDNGQSIQYDSLDNRKMTSYFRYSEQPVHNRDGTTGFSKTLSPRQDWEIVVKAGLDDATPVKDTWTEARNSLLSVRKKVFENSARIQTADKDLAQWIRQSRNDVSLLTAQQDTGLYTYAGLPWFARPFGRDGLITALELLNVNPAIAEGALAHHVRHMARTVDDFRQAQPGKCMHESRLGDLCGAGILPFSEYYGGVDTALLFVMTAHAWWKRTGNDEKMKEFWPAVDLALQWISTYGDLNKDGFVKYASDPGMGLANQGWKDSWDAIMHENGDFAAGPIALCEVQGYAYAAWRGGQDMAAKLGLGDRAAFCQEAADKLYRNFNDKFWQDDLGIYALALDGNDKPCRVSASNMAHLGWCGIVPPERKQRVIDALNGERLNSGWGIRTLAEGEIRYKPDLYHRGPVWPHETGIFARSSRDANDADSVRKIADDMLCAARAFKFRLPELYCGYQKSEGVPPVPYPSANSPHSWAAGLVFSMIDAALGLKIDAEKSEITLNPDGLPRAWAPLVYRDLKVGDGSISFQVDPGAGNDLCIRILEQRGKRVAIRDERTGEIIKPPAKQHPLPGQKL
jgi:glycogen debranching enzyme